MRWLPLCFCVLLCAVDGQNRHTYSDEQLVSVGTLERKFSMYARSDFPASGSYDDAMVDLEAYFSATAFPPARQGLLEILLVPASIYDADDDNGVGYFVEVPEGSKNYQHHFCCTSALGYNCDVGKVVIGSNVRDQVIRKEIYVDNTVPVNKTYFEELITKTDEYYLLLANCDEKLGDVTIDGYMYWRNPFGMLPGNLYGLFWFYGLISLIYLISSLTWFILSACYWRTVLKLQHCIGVVLLLGMLETSTYYFAYLSYDHSGDYPTAAVIFAVLFSVMKHTLSRLLVLVVALGFGVIKPTLGDANKKVIALGLLYFCFGGGRDLYDKLNPSGSPAVYIIICLVLPVAFFDAIFYWWIFVSIARSITHLKQRNQTEKLRMYRMFAVVLAVSIVASTILIAAQIYVKQTKTEDNAWKTEWLFEAYWHTHYFAILIAIMIIWRPNKNNTRYAYMEQLNTEDLEMDDVIPVTSYSAPTQRRADENEPKTANPTELEDTRARTSLLTSAAFAIADEDEHVVRTAGKMQ